MADRAKSKIRKLKCSFTLIVPSMDRHKHQLPEEKVRFWQNKVRVFFRQWFGGAGSGPERNIREMPQGGDYGTGQLVLEPTLHVTANCTPEVFRRRRADIRSLVEEMGRELDQEAVGWFENNVYYEKSLA